MHGDLVAHVTQRVLGDEQVSMAAALRQARHHDVDVIAVGRIEDAATVRVMLDAAESGCLVIAVLDAGTSADALQRLVDLLPARQQDATRARLADVLAAVLVQSCSLGADGGANFEVAAITVPV